MVELPTFNTPIYFCMLQIILAIITGVLAGTFTGLIPGIHINLISIFLISLSATLFSFAEPITLAVFITAMAITHTFVDFIPSIFLGCPDTDTELSILPGHQLLKKGLGYEAVILTCYGSLVAIAVLILLAFPTLFLIPLTYSNIKTLLPYFLIVISIFLILLENKKLKSLFVFLLTGFLGLCVLNFPSLNQPLLPLLSGLFGGSMLVLSIKNKIQIPQQQITKPKTRIFKPLLSAVIASPFCSFLPGLGIGQAAIIGNTISNTNSKEFLFLLGATNTLVMGFSFLSLYTISKTRTGAAVAIKEIIQTLSPQLLLLLLAVVIISGIIAFFLTIFLAKFFAQKLPKFNYTKLSLITLIFLSIIILLISKPLGFFIFIISTFTGIYCISLKVRRTQMMGCLLIPVIFWYLL